MTNKCTDDDLDYYVEECGEILGIDAGREGPKGILHHIFSELVKYKKHNQD
jgi:intraflagellar transport protein 52